MAAIAVNDTIEVAEISEDCFTIDAPLEMGDNILLAGIQTTAGDYVISRPVTVTRTKKSSAWVLQEIVPRDFCADYDHQCYEVEYSMEQGTFS
ncbi:MAG: hypothetical protein U9P10_14670 [Thermodesulfobacteriota bacterium]|nr:hypothetical protein [Thermodesulfobacteriota bacterium]